MQKSKTLEERVAALENVHGKPAFKSMFANNYSGVAETKAAANMASAFQRELDSLEKRVKLLEDQIKKVTK